MMKNILIACFVLLSMNTVARAEREKIGNGGGGFECKNKAGEIESVHLLDIFEGLNPLYPRTQPYQYRENLENVDTEKMVQHALRRAAVNYAYSVELRDAVNTVKRSIQFLQPNTRLVLTDDAYPEIGMKDCSFVQIANYIVEDGEHQRVDIVPELYLKMDVLNQAALIIHEAVYAVSRKHTVDTNSKRSRLITAMLMADDKIDEEIQEETSKVIADSMDDFTLNFLKTVHPKSLVTLRASVDGLDVTQSLFVSIGNEKNFTLSSKGPLVKQDQNLTAGELSKIYWAAYGGVENRAHHYTLQIFINDHFVFGVAGKSSASLEKGVIEIR